MVRVTKREPFSWSGWDRKVESCLEGVAFELGSLLWEGPRCPISCPLHWPESPTGTLAVSSSLRSWCPALTHFLPTPPLQGLLTSGAQPQSHKETLPPLPGTVSLLLVSGISTSPLVFPGSKHFLNPLPLQTSLVSFSSTCLKHKCALFPPSSGERVCKTAQPFKTQNWDVSWGGRRKEKFTCLVFLSVTQDSYLLDDGSVLKVLHALFHFLLITAL